MRLGAARFVAGESLDQAVVVLRALNEKGLLANTTLLGEGVDDEVATREVVASYKEILDRIGAEKLRVNVALKLTHLGLAFDEELAHANIGELVGHAASRGNFVRLDMEESTFVDATLRIFRSLREEGHENVGTVLQSYLYRTPADLDALLDFSPNLRFVKGAYLEPQSVAYPDKRDVDEAYAALVERSLSSSGFTAIATHDTALIERAITYANANQIDRSRFQFQMLYGVRSRLQLDLVATGLRRARRDAVRPRLVPLSHAAPGRAARERSLHREERDPAVALHGTHRSASGVTWSSCVAPRAPWSARKSTAAASSLGSAKSALATAGPSEIGWMPASTMRSATWMPFARSSSAAACVIALTPKAPAAHRPRPADARRDEPPVT